MPARLTVHFPTRPARALLLPEDRQVVVGRDPQCDVVLEDDRISRRHALLACSEACWTITDLASKNGTRIDGVQISKGALAARNWISFGGLVARFEVLPGTVERVEEERLRRFTTSLDLQRGLNPGVVGLAELLPRVVSSMLGLTGAERGFLLLAGPGGDLEVAARSGSSWEDFGSEELGGFGGSLGAVRSVLDTGKPVVSADARSDAELGERASIATTGIRTLLCVPVHALDRLIGVMYADSRRPGAAFTELDLEILEALAAQAGLAIAVARLGAELKGLAGRIAETPGADPALRARLSGEVLGVLERSLPAARPAASRPERWTATLVAPLSAVSPTSPVPPTSQVPPATSSSSSWPRTGP
ncbi:MAG TPA: GAF domain-containing protein [Thermoanaerobaculia bacterium]|nr:GAF domain-containing protein [Thermoanaerobaculia bacterium]